MYAVEIHVISWMLAPSSPRMFGIATFTIDESIVAISEPNAIEIATSHLLTCAGAAADAGGAAAATAALTSRLAGRAGRCRSAGRRRRRAARPARCARPRGP